MRELRSPQAAAELGLRLVNVNRSRRCAPRPVRERLLPANRRRAAALYELEALFAEESWPSEELVCDAERDLYRFPDGEFAFSKEYANERRLRELGFIG